MSDEIDIDQVDTGRLQDAFEALVMNENELKRPELEDLFLRLSIAWMPALIETYERTEAIELRRQQDDNANLIEACERAKIVEGVDMDYELTAEQLDHKYNQDGDGEHSTHTRANWRVAVAAQDTLAGYWDWVWYRAFLERPQ